MITIELFYLPVYIFQLTLTILTTHLKSTIKNKQMKIKVLAFGIAKDIFGSSAVSLELSNDSLVSNLKYTLEKQYPKLKSLSTYMVAVNNEYALPEDNLYETDEIAIIPPVSGG